MPMNDILPYVLAFLAGALLGVVFFAGLWWTVQKGVTSQWPALWFFGSWMLRTGMVLAGFYLVAHGHWSRFLVCLLGFFSARIIVVMRLGRAPAEVLTTESVPEDCGGTFSTCRKRQAPEAAMSNRGVENGPDPQKGDAKAR
jgi:F1F0 ATPase subunit 2